MSLPNGNHFWENLPAIILAGASAIASLVAALISLRNSKKVDEVKEIHAVTDKKVDQITAQTDGMAKALAASEKKVGHAEGVADEKAVTAVKADAHAAGVQDEKSRKREGRNGDDKAKS